MGLSAGLTGVQRHVVQLSTGIGQRRVGGEQINRLAVLFSNDLGNIGLPQIVVFPSGYAIAQYSHWGRLMPVAGEITAMNGIAGAGLNQPLLVVGVGGGFLGGKEGAADASALSPQSQSRYQ